MYFRFYLSELAKVKLLILCSVAEYVGVQVVICCWQECKLVQCLYGRHTSWSLRPGPSKGIVHLGNWPCETDLQFTLAVMIQGWAGVRISSHHWSSTQLWSPEYSENLRGREPSCEYSREHFWIPDGFLTPSTVPREVCLLAEMAADSPALCGLLRV